MNAGGSGLSVGNIATTTISGTVPYHSNLIDRNVEILLYRRSNSTWALMYVWFIKEATVHDHSSLSFSGVDVAAFTNNNYAITAVPEQPGDSRATPPIPAVAYQHDTIGTQFTTAASTLSTLCGITVNIQPNSTGSVTVDTQTTFDTSNSIKSLLEESAKFEAVNYYTAYSNISTATLMKSQFSQVVVSEYAPLTVGQYAPSIQKVVVSCGNGSVQPYEYTGSGTVSSANTLSINTSFIYLAKTTASVRDDPSQPYETVHNYPERIEPTNCSLLVGMGSGRQFSCEKASVDGLISGGQFIVPMSYVKFSHETYQDNQFILTSAQYYLTSEGVYASLSGSSRSISDFDYVGTTEKRVRNKLDVGQEYGSVVFTDGGIELVPKGVTS